MSGKENKFQRNGDVGVLFGKIRRWVIRIFFYLLLFSLSFVFLYPFIIMIVDSFKSDADLANITVKWIPEKLVWNNYVIAFKQLSYQIFVKNSLVMSVTTVVF